MIAARVLPGAAVLPPLDADERPAARGKASKPKGKTAGRFVVLNNFTDFALAELTRIETAVWLILFRDTRDGTAKTSMRDMARRAGCNKRSVVRAIARLESLELVKVVRRGVFRGGSSRYKVMGMPKAVSR